MVFSLGFRSREELDRIGRGFVVMRLPECGQVMVVWLSAEGREVGA